MPETTPRDVTTEPLRASQSFTARILLAAMIWVVIALAAGGFGMSYMFKESVERNFDSRLSTLLDSLVGSSNVDGKGIVSLYRSMMDPRFDRAYSGWYWRISSEGDKPFRSRSLWDEDLAYGDDRRLSREIYVTISGPENQVLRAAVHDIQLPGSTKQFRFLVAGDVDEIDTQVAAFNRMLIWGLSVLGFVMLTTMAIQIRYGLRPLRSLSRKLSDIRSGKAVRIDGAIPRDIIPLVRELNALIDHNAAVVDRAQKHVGNLAHALKTPLTVLANEAATKTGTLAVMVARETDIMRRHVDHHLARARAAARGTVIGSRTDVMPAVRDLVRVIDKIYSARGLKFEIKYAGLERDYVFRGERPDLDDMIGNILDNAGKWAKSYVLCEITRVEDQIIIAIEDDGPGISEKDRALVFARGERMDETVPGSGLGLGIVQDLAELCGGAVALDQSRFSGLRVVLKLPAVPKD